MNNSDQEKIACNCPAYGNSNYCPLHKEIVETPLSTTQEKKCEHDVVAKYCFRCKRPDLAGTPPQHEEWESRFEKEDFSQDWDMAASYLGDYLDYGKLKSFISSLLNQEREKEYLHGLEMGLKEGYKDGLRTAIEHAKVINTTDTNVVDLQEPNK